MGTHISKVKSADLDSWTPEQIENMERWGNAKANVYWEHSWSGEPPEASIDQWIRNKYERKQFAMKGDVPDPSTIDASSGSRVISPSNAQPSPQSTPMFAAFQSAPTTHIPANPFKTTSITQPANTSASSSNTQELFAAFQSAPVAVAAPISAKDVKNDIMSLFASQPSRPAVIQKQPVIQQIPQIQNQLGGLSSMNWSNPVAPSSNQSVAKNPTQPINEMASFKWNEPAAEPTTLPQWPANPIQKEPSVEPQWTTPNSQIANQPSILPQWPAQSAAPLSRQPSMEPQWTSAPPHITTLANTPSISPQWITPHPHTSTALNGSSIAPPWTTAHAQGAKDNSHANQWTTGTQSAKDTQIDPLVASSSLGPMSPELTANNWGKPKVESKSDFDFGTFSGTPTASLPALDEWSSFQ